MNGAPSDAFLWPEHLTNRQLGSFGYVMHLRPKNYYEFGNYLLDKVCFKSFKAMLAAAMKICDGFMMLHRCGYSYQDLNLSLIHSLKEKKLGGRPKLANYQKRTKCFRVMFTENDYIYILSLIHILLEQIKIFQWIFMIQNLF